VKVKHSGVHCYDLHLRRGSWPGPGWVLGPTGQKVEISQSPLSG
jgi:hypothetical protein